MPDTKTIFALRKQGELHRAHELAIDAYSQFPEDEWVKRAYAWVLYDLAKEALNAQDFDLSKKYINVFLLINIPDSDNILHESFEHLVQKSEPSRIELNKAIQLDKSGNFIEAYSLLKGLNVQLHEDSHFNDTRAWNIYKYIKSLQDDISLNYSLITNLLTEYLDLKNTRPSIVHSNILRFAIKTAENEAFDYLHFLQDWDPENFLDEDYKPVVFEGKEYSGLAEKAFMLLGKKLLLKTDHSLIVLFLPYLDLAVSHLNHNIWLPYYKAKLLLLLNRHDEVESFLKPVVKEKRNEFWAWALLGEVYNKTSPSKAIACYCKSLLCTADEKFLINVRSDFGLILYNKGFPDEAKTEFTLSIKSRQANGYRVASALLEIEQQPWFLSARLLENNKQFYLANKTEADEILFADLPWFDGCIGDSFPSKNDPKIILQKIYFTHKGTLHETIVKDKAFKISKRFQQGAAVKVKAECDEGHWQIFLLESRNDGQVWDVFPEAIGIIDRVNADKNFIHFLVSKTTNGVIPFSKLSFTSPTVGTHIAIRYNSKHKDGKNFTEVLFCCKTDTYPSSEILKLFSGQLNIREGFDFGFIDDIFVDPQLIKLNNLSNAVLAHISGTAILSYNEKKGQWGWKAITINTSVK
jgi:hypothetical protein